MVGRTAQIRGVLIINKNKFVTLGSLFNSIRLIEGQLQSLLLYGDNHER